MATQARDAHRRGRDACRASSPPPGCARCSARRTGVREGGTKGSTSARRRASGSTRSTARCSRRPTRARRHRGRSPTPRSGVPSDRRRPARAEQAFRAAVEREAAARAGAGVAGGAGPRDSTRVEDEICAGRGRARPRRSRSWRQRERELDEAETPSAPPSRSVVASRSVRRRIGEDAAGRRAEVEALERSVASSERERERLAGGSRVGPRAHRRGRRRARRPRGRDRDASTTPRRR